MNKVLLALTVSIFSPMITIWAAEPAWWRQPATQIVDPSAPDTIDDNYTIANIGQLKLIATQARQYLRVSIAGGAGTEIDSLVREFLMENEPSSNYAPVNIGQLKSVGQLFYSRLIAAGVNTNLQLKAQGYPISWTSNYPWNTASPVAIDENYVPANVGQLKLVFSFDLSALDSDHDGLADSWEIATLGGTLAQNGEGNSDGDIYSNLEEFRFGLSPSAVNAPIAGADITYDAQGQLRVVGSVPGVPEVSYTYDAAGNVLTSGN